MEKGASEIMSLAKQFKSIAAYVEPFILGGIMMLIGFDFIPIEAEWTSTIIILSGLQLLMASFVGIKLRGLLTPEIKNIRCPNCEGFFTATNLVCQKCGTSINIPNSMSTRSP